MPRAYQMRIFCGMASGVKHGPLIYARCSSTDRRRLFHAGKVFTMKTNTTPAAAPFTVSDDDRYERAARPCPEEYRPAYIHLLKELEADNEDCFSEDAPPLIQFERSVLSVLVSTPDLDPWNMAEIADNFPGCREFSEQLRMLSRLRQREHV